MSKPVVQVITATAVISVLVLVIIYNSQGSITLWAYKKAFGVRNDTNLVYNASMGIFTIDGRPIVWIFWDYTTIPTYIQLSYETIRCHNFKDAYVYALNDSSAKELISNVPDSFDWLIPAHKCDYIRCAILLKYGGIYLDSDTIQLNSLERLWAYLYHYDLFGYQGYQGSSNVMGTSNIGPIKANHTLLQRWKKQADRILACKYESLFNYSRSKQSYPIGWTELLSAILLPTLEQMLKNNETKYKAVAGDATFGQIIRDSSLQESLFVNLTPAIEQKAKNLYFSVELLIYFNSGLPLNVKKANVTQLISMNTLFVELVKKGLLQCAAYQNGQYRSELIDKLQLALGTHL